MKMYWESAVQLHAFLNPARDRASFKSYIKKCSQLKQDLLRTYLPGNSNLILLISHTVGKYQATRPQDDLDIDGRMIQKWVLKSV
jgi:hypothetical protein